ncbi:hypothetical protein FAUST_10868 [Fusarium austroamericanum]|uniref:Uncharacterized protein n=1 Tax=Fusarium austroamericanum TaxID=282268 RepID=A0AAN5Z0X2_FUSAU|nr:hypothetical protein FAUST_10868 [Fusarium austroamericanum]
MAGPPPPNMGSIDRESFHADGPPPSYSETDIYSATTRSPQVPPPTFSAAGPGSGSGNGPAAPGDNIAFPMSPTSTTGSVIYTPPDTPQTVTSNIEKPQQLLRDRIACATRYFETRSYLPSTPRALEYSLTVTPDSVPADIPYPENWAAHDVTAQDWATFVNFLLPDHDSVKNESIFGGEAKSEDGSDAKSATYNANTRPERQAADPSKRHLFRKEAEATVYHWNTGFFTPRGVVVLFVPGEPVHMPGGQEAARNNPLEGIPQVGASYQREAMPQRRDGRFQGGWGGPRMNDGGIRQGDRFVVDGNGIRIGDLHIDSRGIRMGEQGAGDAWLFGPGRGRGHMHAPRGRGPHNHHHGARNHSSSTSSSSSSDSSSSCESIGSLPDHDDIKDEQLPFYIARVEQWIANPHEVRSKADVKQLKAELKAGKRNTAPLDPNIDRKELKKQSKAVAHQWKSLKRDQKRGKQERKRAEKEAKRRIKRELRESRRDCRREQKGRGRGRGRANPPGVPGFPSVPSNYIPGWVQSHTDHVPIPPQGRGDPWGWPGRGFHG